MTRLERRAKVALAGAGGLGAAAVWAMERRGRLPAAIERRRRLQRIAADPEYAFLSAPPAGRPISVHSLDGTVLHAEAFGPEGAPTVVLAHGWTEALRFWIKQISELSRQDFRVVAYDLRGHGRSAKAHTGDYTLAAFGDDVEAVLRQCVPPNERAVLVGHSLGAMSIAAWAERHPVAERASAAGLLCTGLVDLLTEQLVFRPPWIPPAMFRPISEHVLGAPGAIPAFSPQLLDAVVRYVAFGPAAGPAQIAFYEQMLRECPPDVRASTAAAMSSMDLLHVLQRLTVPTLVLVGSEDRLTPPSHARRIASALPDPIGIVELPLTGHMAPLERPAEVNRWLRNLAQRAGGATARVPGASRAA
jgi:pimeloyl-ACP methyl ester carboxylesterase